MYHLYRRRHRLRHLTMAFICLLLSRTATGSAASVTGTLASVSSTPRATAADAWLQSTAGNTLVTDLTSHLITP